MQYFNLSNSGMTVSSVGLGIMRMDGLTADQAAKAISTAYESGINFIDSADIYGGGKSEEVFRAGLAKSNLKREDFYFQSKVGIVPDGPRYDFSKNHILEGVDGILQRSGVEYLDTLLLHRPDVLMDVNEVAEAFGQLRSSGKVRYFGVSNFDSRQIDWLQANLPDKLLIDQVQFGLMHTGMIDQQIHVNMTDPDSIDHDGGLLAYAQLHDLTLQAWSPFQFGNFAGTFINNPMYPKLNDKLAELAKKYLVSKNAIATNFILRVPANFQVMIGTMNPEHIKDSATGADFEMDRQDWYDLYLAAGHELP